MEMEIWDPMIMGQTGDAAFPARDEKNWEKLVFGNYDLPTLHTE